MTQTTAAMMKSKTSFTASHCGDFCANCIHLIEGKSILKVLSKKTGSKLVLQSTNKGTDELIIIAFSREIVGMKNASGTGGIPGEANEDFQVVPVESTSEYETEFILAPSSQMLPVFLIHRSSGCPICLGSLKQLGEAERRSLKTFVNLKTMSF